MPTAASCVFLKHACFICVHIQQARLFFYRYVNTIQTSITFTVTPWHARCREEKKSIVQARTSIKNKCKTGSSFCFHPKCFNLLFHFPVPLSAPRRQMFGCPRTERDPGPGTQPVPSVMLGYSLNCSHLYVSSHAHRSVRAAKPGSRYLSCWCQSEQ